MDVQFIILCPEKSITNLKNTFSSIQNNTCQRSSICIVGSDISAKELAEMKKVCPTFKGGDTITSLINLGMKKLESEWGLIVFAGSRVQRFVERKIDQFCKNNYDVLFPVVNKKWGFVEGTFDGVLINKSFFEEVGTFPEICLNESSINDFEFAKMLWALDATQKGAKFKAIVGMRMT